MQPVVNNLILKIRDLVEIIFVGLNTFEFVLDGCITQFIQIEVPESGAIVQNVN
jgi:hypothetical protein